MPDEIQTLMRRHAVDGMYIVQRLLSHHPDEPPSAKRLQPKSKTSKDYICLFPSCDGSFALSTSPSGRPSP